ncbi:di-trans,poly-cis-decaprenylcistransferase [Candidatus Woesearchaeota archaeon]|nr:di-trans,poly-cis-decaprenylcistransferase [Candidatus Woesearchaeota archaeon]
MKTTKIPNHIAIQMDGNRRWGEKNKGNMLAGHIEGAKTLKKILDHCLKIGVKIVTVYALSIENLNRGQNELKLHFKLHERYIRRWILNSDTFVKNKMRFRVLGRKELLPKQEQELIKKAEEKTKMFNERMFNVCICYNGHDEIVDAVKKIIRDKVMAKDITRERIKQYLYTKDIPPPDMMIKTGMNPEKRISGFLLWDISYTELFFSSTLWPDFSPHELDNLIEEYSKRERRFGR